MTALKFLFEVRIYDRSFRLWGSLELNSLLRPESRANGTGATPWRTNEPSLSPNAAGVVNGKGGAGGPGGGPGRALRQCYKVLLTADHRLLVAELTSRAVHAFALELPESLLQQLQPQPQPHAPRTIAAAAAAMVGADSFLQQIGRPGGLDGIGNGAGVESANGEKTDGERSRTPESDAAQQQSSAQIGVRRLGSVLTDVVIGGWALDSSTGDVYIFDLCTKSLDMYKLLQSS